MRQEILNYGKKEVYAVRRNLEATTHRIGVVYFANDKRAPQLRPYKHTDTVYAFNLLA
jgi:hypothetical protein